MFEEDSLVKLHRPRIELISNLMLLLFGVILARLWFLQIYSGEMMYQYSLENRLRREIVKAPRGMMFSRDNYMMVHNVPRFDAMVTPQYLKYSDKTLEELGNILDMSLGEIKKIMHRSAGQAKYRPITIKKNLSIREVAIIETENFKMPGVSVLSFIGREYTDGQIGTHLLGYISEISQHQLPKYQKRDGINYKLGDFIGQAGIEEHYDQMLRGQDGHEYMEVDALGRMTRSFKTEDFFYEIENQPAVPGNNVRLTVDQDLQKVAYNALEGRVGGAVAVEVNSGEVLAIVSRPSVDSAQFSFGLSKEYWQSLVNDERNPLRDRTIQEHFSPGSTFKTLTAIVGLEEGLVDEHTEVHCTGAFKFGRRLYHCWKKEGHGRVNVRRAIKESCDVFFYRLATRLDIDVLAKYAKLFGFGAKTGIDLPRETTGLIPTKEWKKKRNGEDWQVGETLSSVIGQSFVLTTPIQLAMFYASIANGGKLYRPFVVREIFSNAGDLVKKNGPKIVAEVKLSKKTLDYVHDGLFRVVNDSDGTAWRHRGEGLRMSGKTGTAQVIQISADKIFAKCDLLPYKYRHHGLFTAYAPMPNPKIAVAVVVEHGCSGSGAAAPVAKEIITAYLNKYYPDLVVANILEDKQKSKSLLKQKTVEEVKKIEDDSQEEVIVAPTMEE